MQVFKGVSLADALEHCRHTLSILSRSLPDLDIIMPEDHLPDFQLTPSPAPDSNLEIESLELLLVDYEVWKFISLSYVRYPELKAQFNIWRESDPDLWTRLSLEFQNTIHEHEVGYPLNLAIKCDTPVVLRISEQDIFKSIEYLQYQFLFHNGNFSSQAKQFQFTPRVWIFLYVALDHQLLTFPCDRVGAILCYYKYCILHAYQHSRYMPHSRHVSKSISYINCYLR